MNILITGASGFIATALIENAAPGWKLTGISRTGSSLAHTNYPVDLSKSDSVDHFINTLDTNIDLIIHTASALADKHNIRSMRLFYDNLAITESVIKIINERKIPRLINISSTAVYPNIDGTFTESAVVNPSVNNDCLYGLAKFSSENLFDYFLGKTLSQTLHLRVSQVYGDNMRSDRTHKIMLKELQESRTITIFGNGERVSNFINVKLLTSYLKFCIDNNLQGIYNIGRENLSYLQLAEGIIKKANISDARIVLESKGIRSKTVIDTSKFDSLYQSQS